jgi:hypothetical protein
MAVCIGIYCLEHPTIWLCHKGVKMELKIKKIKKKRSNRKG